MVCVLVVKFDSILGLIRKTLHFGDEDGHLSLMTLKLQSLVIISIYWKHIYINMLLTIWPLTPISKGTL